MIEAVNSAVANAALLRGNVEQAASVRSGGNAGNIQNLEKPESQLAPYVRLFVQVDNDFDKAVLQIRDSETGDVENQFPSETTLRARAAQAEIESQSIRNVAEAVTPETSNSSAPTPTIQSGSRDSVTQQATSTPAAFSSQASQALLSSSASSQSSASSVSVLA